MEEYEIDFKLEDVNEKDNRFVFTAVSITKDFVNEKGRKELAEDSKRKHVVWRHEHPLIPKFSSTHIYGRVLDSEATDGKIVSKYEIYDHTPEHLKVREVVKKRFELGDPIKISMRYRQYGKDPIHYDVIEHSLTPTPACKECKAIEIINEDDKMDEKELAEQIKKLEAELTKKDKVLEGYEDKIKSIEKQLEDEISNVKTGEKKLEKSEQKNKEITETLLEFKDKLNEQKKMIDKLQENNALQVAEPLITELVGLDGKDMEQIYRDRVLSAYSKSKCENDEKIFEDCLQFLRDRTKKLEGAAHVVVKSLEQTADESQIQDEEMEDDNLRKARDKKAFTNMPEEFFKWKKNKGGL